MYASRYEGKPITVTEAMILGTPPVVTAYLSAHEQIETGKEGLVLENRDDSVAAGLAQCMQDREQLQAMAALLRTREYGNTEQLTKIEQELFCE